METESVNVAATETNSAIGTLSENAQGNCDSQKSILECIGDQYHLRGSKSNHKRQGSVAKS